MHIGTLLPRHARCRPDHLAFVFGTERLSYRDFNARVNALSNAVLARGLKKGDKVATLLPNCLELMTLYWMAAKTGLVVVPLSTLLQESGLRTLLRDSDSVMVFADPGFAETMDRLRPDLPAIGPDRVILAGAGGPAPQGFLRYEDLVAGASEEEPPEAGLCDDDLYNIMYSSGTTGAPKGIMLSHYVRANYATVFAASFRMTPESVVLHTGSIVFNGAMIDLMPWMFLGCSYILHAAFDPGATLAAIEAEKVTHIVLVPSQIIALLDHSDFDPGRLGSLTMILSVGAPLHLEHKQRLNSALPGRFFELYGLTEGFATVLDGQDSLRKAGSVGVPPSLFELQIQDEEGRPRPTGEVGEICGRAPMQMTGYYKQPELTAEALRGGWLHSGDAGYVDEEGFLYLVDRIKDLIVSGGVNVYPKDIEEIAVQHPAVSEAAVFGRPDEKWGETAVAALCLHPGAALEPADFIAWLNERVGAKYQRIADAIILEAFPRNIAGKTLKREIRATYLETR